MPESKFISTLKKQLNDMASLRIVTAVGGTNIDYTVNEDNTSSLTVTTNTEKAAFTEIDVVSGDIATVYGEDFYEDYPDLRTFHHEQQEKGYKILQSNIQAVLSLINLDKKLNKEQ